MPWILPADARSDLRALLSDGPTDKLRYRKRMIGDVNGVNLRFKSFEFRRVTDFFTESSLSLGVFVNGVRQTEGVQVTADFPEIGEVILSTAPSNTSRVEGTFYIQWFKDSELDVFLKNATQWLSMGEDVTKVEAGLQPASLYYAAQEAMHKMAVRWAERLSETYKMEDQIQGATTPVDDFRRLAKDYRDKSEALRKNFYLRNDQAEAPLFGVAAGRVCSVVPKR